MKKVNIVKLHAAAFLFSRGTNTAKALATTLETAEAVIYRWVKLPQWNDALDKLGYTGDRKLHRDWRDIQRESGDLVNLAKATYCRLRSEGTPKHKLIPETARTLSLPIPRVRNWSKRFKWAKVINDV